MVRFFLRVGTLDQRLHLQFTEFFPGPVKMFVFFVLNFTGGRTQDFAQAILGSLTGNFPDQFPVRVILSLGQDDVFDRVQLSLIFRETIAIHAAQQGLGFLGRHLCSGALHASISAKAVNHISEYLLVLNRLPVKLAELGSHFGIGNQSECLLVEFLAAHLDGQEFAQDLNQRALIDSRA